LMPTPLMPTMLMSATSVHRESAITPQRITAAALHHTIRLAAQHDAQAKMPGRWAIRHRSEKWGLQPR
jgi:hypothetical protein